MEYGGKLGRVVCGYQIKKSWPIEEIITLELFKRPIILEYSYAEVLEVLKKCCLQMKDSYVL